MTKILQVVVLHRLISAADLGKFTAAFRLNAASDLEYIGEFK